MSVMVRIPTPLRRMTNGESKVEIESSNLGELVDKLDGAYPGFKDRLVDENGELRYFVNIYVNGEDVRFLDGLGTAISSGSEVSIVPAVAGGGSGGVPSRFVSTKLPRMTGEVTVPLAVIFRMLAWVSKPPRGLFAGIFTLRKCCPATPAIP